MGPGEEASGPGRNRDRVRLDDVKSGFKQSYVDLNDSFDKIVSG